MTLIFSYMAVCLKLLTPGGVRRIVSENVLLRQQLITLSRKHKRAPKLTFFDKITFGIFTSMVSLKRLQQIAVIIKQETLLKYHRALVNRKYSLLFSNRTRKKSGPKGPKQSMIDLILEMKKRNPSYGCRRIAMQISSAFGIPVDKDIVRRVLSKHYKRNPEDTGPSWLTFIGHMKDSLWSIDLFRSESIHLKTHWIMVVMDQFTRRIIGFASHEDSVTGIDLCCMFNKIITKKTLPRYLSSDNDPLFHFYRWRANLRILGIEEIKSVPYVPTSHPFVERLIGTVRHELLDRTLYWSAHDLQYKIELFQNYYNKERCHYGIDGVIPLKKTNVQSNTVIPIEHYRWKKHCQGLYQLPIAA